ncbi:MAG: 3-deoxy-manno-octulosonate cytidylyltransferase [Acidobacteria bacterium]|nr:3-deoxy-manno-octulosonate cytidylyltransferase [Acidobacteriota bacterium]
MDCVAIIPARYGSTRFPGKPLATLEGTPLICHVATRCAQVEGLDRVVVATDDERIAEAARDCGVEAVMTSPDFASGTDRIAHVAADLGADIVLNVQGDEPLINPEALSGALREFRAGSHELGTLRAPLTDSAQLWDPHCVKLVVDRDGTALYFSRAPIPYSRDSVQSSTVGPGGKGALEFIAEPPQQGACWIHVGVYMYRTPALQRWARMPRSQLEIVEDLEQLRVLEAGERIQTFEVAEAFPGIDTPADLERVRRALTEPKSQDYKP